MILHSIRLHPFAGIVDKQYFFNPDLTTIYGPNEEGKSTVAKAIQQVLFLEINLTPAKKQNHLKDIMPVVGGDTIRVTLKFLCNGFQYTLEKQWGATQFVNLLRSDGVSITDNNVVQQQTIDMLPANQAVVEQILIASQSKLTDAISNLSSDVQTSLAEKLRAAILSGGGVSGTQLENTIAQKIVSFFGRWDEAAGRPDGGSSRGLTNPWRNGVGYISEAWYQLEQAKANEKQTEYYETESNRLQTESNKINEELKIINTFLETNKSAYGAVNQRISIEAEINAYRNSLEKFRGEALRWPMARVEKSTAETALAEVSTELKELDIELQQARQKQNAQKELLKLTQVDTLTQKVAESEQALSAFTKISEGDVESAQQHQQKIMNCKSIIQGQRLRFIVDAVVSGQIEALHSGGQNESITFIPTEKIEREVSGSIQFEWKGVAFTIQSANEDISAIEAAFRNAQTELNFLLEKYYQPTVEALISLAKDYRNALILLKQSQSNLASALGNDTVEDLVLRCEAVNALPGTRNIDVIEKLIKDKTQLIGSYKTTVQSLSKELLDLESKHQSQDNLIKRQLDDMLVIQQREKTLSELPSLPEGYESAIHFQEQYNTFQAQKQEEIGVKHKIEMDMQALTIPQISLTEAKEQTILKERIFQHALTEGKAYRRIQQALRNILASADSNAFQPLHTKTEVYLNQLSSGRFKSIPFNITQPQKLEGDGVALPVSLLSKGTKDILALALRLAAADVYLESNSGFVMMDDPLVDMDLKRREASAAVLKGFSKRHQTIIFTCHEGHEALLTDERLSNSLM